ncbi:hypothetical protein [Maribacter aurantiacus]|uniref:Uncharacterized protein n=1 Tax=Maribacter aurantiacus TaxID=1882343 RepID=A0A5R8M0R4_9FLAO|nr:hypothetical protein [Maribacter aurantiacus]TLF43193.1 hypothetical protein FEK29_13850 [Maribacter aurantiacus]
MKDYKEFIKEIFELIERKLSRGNIHSWETRDYQALSVSIQKETGTLLSVSTLKRLSGKVKYGSRPNTATLNALAQYVGFKDWRAFVQDSEASNPPIQKLTKTKGRNTKILLILILVLIASIFAFFGIEKNKPSYKSDDFVFKGKSVTTGLPNSVVFNFDASVADEDAKIEIQQDWDKRKRTLVNKNDSVSTSIYYWPGYFKSKLVIDDTIVKEHDILIPTVGWLGMIEQEEQPIYLDPTDIYRDKSLAISKQTLLAHNVDPSIEKVVVGFYLVKDFGEIYTDNFEMNASVRNEYMDGLSGACQRVTVLVLYDGGAIGIPLSKNGCISELTLMTFEDFVDGKKSDLSGFGVDFSKYVRLKCISKDQKFNVFIDDKPVYHFKVPETPKKIYGICIYFEGSGSIQYVSFENDSSTLYNSNFNL